MHNEVYGLAKTLFYDMDQYMLKAFVAALLNGEPVPVTGLDGKRSTEVALSAYASAAIQQPVKL